MTVTLNPWVAWLVVALALGGLWSACTTVADVVRGVWDWWRDRREPLTDEDESCGLCAGCVGFEHCDGRELGCECTCTWPEDWAEPLEGVPERSREELGFTGPQPAVRGSDRHADDLMDPGGLWHGPGRERWAPAWEAEARGAYQALDLDYPSGLLARVREAGQ